MRIIDEFWVSAISVCEGPRTGSHYHLGDQAVANNQPELTLDYEDCGVLQQPYKPQLRGPVHLTVFVIHALGIISKNASRASKQLKEHWRSIAFSTHFGKL